MSIGREALCPTHGRRVAVPTPRVIFVAMSEPSISELWSDAAAAFRWDPREAQWGMNAIRRAERQLFPEVAKGCGVVVVDDAPAVLVVSQTSAIFGAILVEEQRASLRTRRLPIPGDVEICLSEHSMLLNEQPATRWGWECAWAGLSSVRFSTYQDRSFDYPEWAASGRDAARELANVLGWSIPARATS